MAGRMRDVLRKGKIMRKISCKLYLVALIAISFLSPFAAIADTTISKTGLYFQFVKVVASDRQKAGLSEKILSTAIVNGTLIYVIATDNKISFAKGIPPEFIIGLLREPSKGFIKGNIVKGVAFFQKVWSIAAAYMDDDLKKSIMENEFKTSILIDGRAPDPTARLSVLRPDVIGFYMLKDGKIIFEPNEDYELINENGPIQTTPFIVKALFSN
jgi:hypothetical protein